MHSLRTRGDLSFEELNLVVPCLEMGFDYGYTDLQAFQVATPRIFKTHLWWPHCPRAEGVRYIYVVRDPVDAAHSFYHFMSGWFFEAGAVSLDEFVGEFFAARGAPPTPMQNASHWHNLVSWYPHRRDPNVLWLFYEDLVADLAAGVARIADFLRLGHDDPALQAVAAAQSSIDAMRAHPDKYDEHMLKLARNEACGLPPRAGLDGRSAGKVRAGGAGGGRAALSPDTQEALRRRWAEVVLPATGYATYDELRRGVNDELGRSTHL